MISITQTAAERIRESAAESGVAPPVLRVAAKMTADGAVDFGMGFDQTRPGDTTIEVEGIHVVVAPAGRPHGGGPKIDFVEIEPGDFRFVFAPEGGPEPG